MRIYILAVLLLSVTALNFEAALMSHTLAEVDALDTSQLNCQTPKSHFDELEQTLTQWQNVLENQDRIPQHIETLTEMKHLIKHKNYKKLVSKIKELDLITPPVLSELESKLQGLQSHDAHERQECTDTLMKLCAYLIKQMGNVHQQCQQSPVTVIKVKGKIEDLKIIQSGCQQACQPACPEEQPPQEQPFEEQPEDVVEEEIEPTSEENPEETEVPPTPPSEPTPPLPVQPEEETTPSTEETTQPEEAIPEPPVNPSQEESPEEAIEQEEEWTIPGEEPEVDEEEEVPTTSPEEEQTQPPNEQETEEEAQEPEETQTNEPEEEQEVPVTPEDAEETVSPSEEEEGSVEEQLPEEEQTVEQPAEEEEGTVPTNPLEEEEQDQPESVEEEEETLPAYGEEEEQEVTPTEEEQSPEEEGEESVVPVRRPVSITATEQQCQAADHTDVVSFSATQTESQTGWDLSLQDDTYGFGLYFKWLQRWPENAQGSKFHLASLSNNGQLVLGLYFTYDGIQCVTANGDGEEHVNVEFDDVEGDWGTAYISYSNGQTTCVVQYFEEQPQIRQVASTHSQSDSLHFQIGGSDGKHPSFQGDVTNYFAVSGNVYVGSLKQYEQVVTACNQSPQQICDRNTQNLGDFQFYGNQEQFDDSVNKQAVNILGDQYSVSGWFKWHEIQDQDVWHTVFRLSSNVASGSDVVLGDRDLALFVGSEMVRSTLQFTTYTYTDLTGEGNPNLWQTVPYEDQLTKWHYIYFGYNRYEREAFVFVQFVSHTVTLEFKDINHFVIPEKVLYVGADGLYPAYSGEFYNFHFNSCNGAFELEPFTEEFGYIPPPVDDEPVPEPIEEPEEPQAEEEVEEQQFEEEVPQEEQPESPEEEQPESPEEEQPENPEEEQSEDVPPQEDEPTPEEETAEPTPEEEVIPPNEEPVVPDEIKPVPKPEDPKPAPVVPSEPQVPAVKECEATIEVTKENAADILCAISEYLAQLASGHIPELGVNPSRVCFCLEYDDTDNGDSFMQIEALLTERNSDTLEQLVVQRRRRV